MANVRTIEIVMTDTEESYKIAITSGDSIRARQWAKDNYPDPPAPDLSAGLSDEERDFNRELYRTRRDEVETEREIQGGNYAIFLTASRLRLPHTESDHMAFLDYVTIPEDEVPADEAPVEPGESTAPTSDS